MVIIPLLKLPNQKFEIVLNNQDCIINLFQRGDNLFMDLTVNNIPVAFGAICEDRNNIIQTPATSFIGNLFFADMAGTNDPEYSTLGVRFLLFYTEASNV